MDARFWLVRTRPLELGLLDVGHIYRELEGSSGTPFDTHEVLEAGAISRLAVLERRELNRRASRTQSMILPSLTRATGDIRTTPGGPASQMCDLSGR